LVDDDSLVILIMTHDVRTVTPDTPVTTAARLMVAHGVSSLPVIKDGELVGMITETDIISREIEVDAPAYGTFLDAVFRWPWDHTDDEVRRITAVSVGQLMTHPVYSLTTSATVRDAATLLFERKITAAPVVDSEGTIVGIVSQSDILQLVADVGGDDAPDEC
jgi:CBS domain-containing protein